MWYFKFWTIFFCAIDACSQSLLHCLVHKCYSYVLTSSLSVLSVLFVCHGWTSLPQCINRLRFSQQEKGLFGSVSEDGAVRVWSVESRRMLVRLSYPHTGGPETGGGWGRWMVMGYNRAIFPIQWGSTTNIDDAQVCKGKVSLILKWSDSKRGEGENVWMEVGVANFGAFLLILAEPLPFGRLC